MLPQGGNLKSMEQKHCKYCGQVFIITDDDIKFYEKMDIPLPTLCPEDRQRRRLSWRNERTLYQGECDLCGKSMISLYSPNSKFKVYCQDCWWSDKFDPFKYAKEFDFSRPFFEQFHELLKEVPMFGLVNGFNTLENSNYVNYVTDAKNCYLVFAANYLEDCMYSAYIWQSKDTLDCSYSTGLELCYECVDCDALYGCKYLQNCRGCNDCTLCYGLSSCKNCFGCVNLRNKEYCFYNEQLSKDEYKSKVNDILKDQSKFDKYIKDFDEFTLKYPRKFAHQINCENSTGDSIKNCKNVFECFEGYGSEDLKWVINFPGEMKDCYDICGAAKVELAVDSSILVPAYNVKYSNCVLNSGANITLSAFIDGGNNIFGCVGMKKGEYCIFNKKYSQKEFYELTEKIIKHMKGTREWGEFFPAELSLFAYNETVAQEYHPLTQSEALKRGYRWQPKNEKEYQKHQNISFNNIEEVDDKILNDILSCEQCGRNYKINQQELNFYRKLKIVIPKYCHQCRHEKRISKRPSRKLWTRECDKCSMQISTPYSKESPEIIYCEKCYLDTII